MVSNIGILEYYGDIKSSKNKLHPLDHQDQSMVTCLKQLEFKYLAVCTIRNIEIFDLVTRSSIRYITDLGLSLFAIFRVNSLYLNKQAFSFQARA